MNIRDFLTLHIHTNQCKGTTLILYEEFEDTKGVIRIRKSKKNRQHNGQKNKRQKD